MCAFVRVWMCLSCHECASLLQMRHCRKCISKISSFALPHWAIQTSHNEEHIFLMPMWYRKHSWWKIVTNAVQMWLRVLKKNSINPTMIFSSERAILSYCIKKQKSSLSVGTLYSCLQPFPQYSLHRVSLINGRNFTCISHSSMF